MKNSNDYRKQIGIYLGIIMMFLLFLPYNAEAKENGKTVRVGWHEAPYCITDETGRRSGYTYEYQQKIAAYTGWNYEYVKGSWSELLHMLKTGEIDMLGNVSHSSEREKGMLYASLPMGTETYYLFTDISNKEIKSDDYASLNGKKVSIAKDSIQYILFQNGRKNTE